MSILWTYLYIYIILLYIILNSAFDCYIFRVKPNKKMKIKKLEDFILKRSRKSWTATRQGSGISETSLGCIIEAPTPLIPSSSPSFSPSHTKSDSLEQTITSSPKLTSDLTSRQNRIYRYDIILKIAFENNKFLIVIYHWFLLILILNKISKNFTKHFWYLFNRNLIYWIFRNFKK